MIEITNNELRVRVAWESKLTGVVEYKWEVIETRRDYMTEKTWLHTCAIEIARLPSYAEWDGVGGYVNKSEEG